MSAPRLTNRPFGRFARLLVLVFFFLVITLPNALRYITLPLFLVLGLVSICELRSVKRSLVTAWLLSSCITFLYLAVGIPYGYPAAITQTIFVYVVSPFIWIVLLSFVFSQYSIQSILRTVLVFSFIGAVSVPAYLAWFRLFGPDALTWIYGKPNALYMPGVVHVSMHVMGSLSFTVAGFFSCSRIVRKSLLRFAAACAFLIAAAISGRSALFVSLFLGALFSFLSDYLRRYVDLVVIASDLVLWSVLGFSAYWLSTAANLNLIGIVHSYLNHILTMGGEERVLQAKALVAGILSNHLLGSGHGVGVDVVRNSEYPWRYELFYLATLYRVGLAGFVVYSLPALFVIGGYLNAYREESHSWLRLVDRFALIGFIAALVISGTNPYLESFDFQWMFWAPVVYFANRKSMGQSLLQGKL